MFRKQAGLPRHSLSSAVIADGASAAASSAARGSTPLNQQTADTNTPATPATRLFMHSKREQWGLAILLWERDGKRGYRFEDGSERTFKDGYYHLFVPRTPGELTEQQQALLTVKPAASADEISLHHQLAFLESLYPGGFAGETWQIKRRDPKKNKALKRHRDPVVRAAKAVLSKGELASLSVAGEHAAVLARVVELLDSSDLVAKRYVNQLADAKPSAALTQALTAYLHGPEESEAAAFTGWIGALRSAGVTPNWAVATALRAVVHPERHVAVRPTALRKQFGLLGTSVLPSKKPSAASYEHCRKTLQNLRTQLCDLGQAPKDMLDVYDFVWVTLRPAALKQYAGGAAGERDVRNAA